MWLSHGHSVVVCWTGRRENLPCLEVKGQGEYLLESFLEAFPIASAHGDKWRKGSC